MVGAIETGLVALIGVGHDDTSADADAMARKIVSLRVFPDAAGRMNLSVADVGGGVLVVSQFTLLADVRKGRRPSLAAAAEPDAAQPLVEQVAAGIEAVGVHVERGTFGRLMEVELINHGPVTVVLEVAGGRVA